MYRTPSEQFDVRDEQERQQRETPQEFGTRLFRLMSARLSTLTPLPRQPNVSS